MSKLQVQSLVLGPVIYMWKLQAQSRHTVPRWTLLQLAEIVEMIHAAHSIHQSVMNIPVNISAEPDPEVRKRKTATRYGGGEGGVSSLGPLQRDGEYM